MTIPRALRAHAHALFIAIATLLALLAPRRAHAIPAFARAYDVPCSTCHVVITRRNEFGDLFRKAGFRWPSAASADVEGRRPLTMAGTSAFPTLFPSKIPVGLSATFSGSVSNDANAKNPTLGSPAVNLLFGSALSEHISFFGTLPLSNPTPNELYLHFARLFGRPELNIRAGLFEQTTTLFKANEALLANYILGSSSLNGHAVSRGRLGAEMNGILGERTFWAAGLVENAEPGSNMDAYYHVSQKIGGRNLHGERPDIDTYDPSLMDKLNVTVGHWGYVGRVFGPAGERVSGIRRLGFDAKIQLARLGVWAGTMFGFDRDFAHYEDTRNVTWFAEASYAVRTWFMPMYMVQYQDSAGYQRPVQVHDLGMVFLPLENLRVRVKGTFSADGTRNEAAELQALVGF